MCPNTQLNLWIVQYMYFSFTLKWTEIPNATWKREDIWLFAHSAWLLSCECKYKSDLAFRLYCQSMGKKHLVCYLCYATKSQTEFTRYNKLFSVIRQLFPCMKHVFSFFHKKLTFQKSIKQARCYILNHPCSPDTQSRQNPTIHKSLLMLTQAGW